jgi:hypothetical protein
MVNRLCTNVISTGPELAGPTGSGAVPVWLREQNWKWLVSYGTSYKCPNWPVLYVNSNLKENFLK